MGITYILGDYETLNGVLPMPNYIFIKKGEFAQCDLSYKEYRKLRWKWNMK